MPLSPNSLEITPNWWDDDLVGYFISASNGQFSGEVEIYASHNDLSDFANILEGFPRQTGDVREFELGNFDPKFGGGGVSFEFRTSDSVGHIVIVLKIQSDKHRSHFVQETSTFAIQTVPAEIDRFVDSLRNFKLQRGNTIRLPHAP